jgi:hypothetical protein
MFLPKFSVSSVAALALLASSTAFAQFNATNPNSSSVEGTTIPGSGDLLWDNTNINVDTPASGIVSLEAGDQTAGSNQVISADDFVVPAGETWNINFLHSVGFLSATSQAPQSFGVEFFADNGGSPGAVIARHVIPLGGNTDELNQELSFPNTTFSEGTYWVSVFGIYDTFTDLTTHRWNWQGGSATVGALSHLQDTGSFFGSPIAWTSIGGLVGDNSLDSLFFALRGSVDSGVTLPPPASVPTMNTWGLLALALGLMLGGAFAMRKRFQ